MRADEMKLAVCDYLIREWTHDIRNHKHPRASPLVRHERERLFVMKDGRRLFADIALTYAHPTMEDVRDKLLLVMVKPQIVQASAVVREARELLYDAEQWVRERKLDAIDPQLVIVVNKSDPEAQVLADFECGSSLFLWDEYARTLKVLRATWEGPDAL